MYIYIWNQFKTCMKFNEVHVNIHLEMISTYILIIYISSMNQLPLTKISFTSVQTLQAQSESPQVGFLPPKKKTTTVISSKNLSSSNIFTRFCFSFCSSAKASSKGKPQGAKTRVPSNGLGATGIFMHNTGKNLLVKHGAKKETGWNFNSSLPSSITIQ